MRLGVHVPTRKRAAHSTAPKRRRIARVYPYRCTGHYRKCSGAVSRLAVRPLVYRLNNHCHDLICFVKLKAAWNGCSLLLTTTHGILTPAGCRRKLPCSELRQGAIPAARDCPAHGAHKSTQASKSPCDPMSLLQIQSSSILRANYLIWEGTAAQEEHAFE